MPLALSLLARAAAKESDSDLERAQHLARTRDVAQSIRLLADPQRGESAVMLKQEPGKN